VPFEELRGAARYAVALHRYLQTPSSRDQALRHLRDAREQRERNFLELVDRGIYDRQGSPYRALLDHAGVTREDVHELVTDEGLEGALAELHEAGVHLSSDEFNGRTPIRRGSLVLEVDACDFDNPLCAGHFTGTSGGTGGPPKRLPIDLRGPAHRAAVLALFLDAYDLWRLPVGMWFPLPPGTAGVEVALVNAKLGRSIERWFTPTTLRSGTSAWRAIGLVGTLVALGRAARLPVPVPRATPPEQAERVTRWLASCTADGAPALFSTTPSFAVRICRAASEVGLDVAGTMFWLGGEPYTAAKADAVAAVGCEAVNHYYMTEIGQIGLACADPVETDDVHVLDEMLGLVARPVATRSGAELDALFFTGLRTHAPKLMLNVESGDCATVEERECSCAIGAFGFGRHLHTIRAYEKLTSEGMHFGAADLVDLVEAALPARFGGVATDWQLVEEEDPDGSTVVVLRASRRLGALAEDDVRAAALEILGRRGRPEAMMADVWRRAGTLRVERAEPIVSDQGKIAAVRTLRREAALQRAP
jgi:hypothetical protein